MKLLAFLLLLVTSATYAADSVRVFEDRIPYSRSYTRSYAKFHMDRESSLGFAVIEVTEEYEVVRWETVCNGSHDPRRPSPICHQVPRTVREYRTIYNHTEQIPNLVLEGDKMIYHGSTGAVDCGTLGLSRVFRRPTLYLTGNCNLNSHILFDRADKKVVVDFVAK